MATEIPKLMTAVICTKYGPPSVLQQTKLPVPSLTTPNDILIKVYASGIAKGDIEVRSMSFPPSIAIPMRLASGVFKPRCGVIGFQFSGQVVKIGNEVKKFSVGDYVYGKAGFELGANAEYMKIKDGSFGPIISKKPDEIGLLEASVLGMGAIEAYAFMKQGGVAKGSKLLIVGAAGNIGSFAVQLAKSHFGVEKVVCVDSGSNIGSLKEYGADEVIDYKSNPNYLKSDEVYDVILDVPGALSFVTCKHALSDKGAYVVGLFGASELLKSNLIGKSGKRFVCAMSGTSNEENEEALEVINRLISERKLKSIIDKTFPLNKIVEAHEYHESGEKMGCIAITMND